MLILSWNVISTGPPPDIRKRDVNTLPPELSFTSALTCAELPTLTSLNIIDP